jgi:DNA-binding transcriptional MerR regulator
MSQQGKERDHEKAITALLSSPSIEAAAKKCGVTKRTLLRWMKDETFFAEYRETRKRLLRAATARLSRNAFRAADVLGKIFTGRPMPYQAAKVSAAIGTLRLAQEADLIEDLEERIRRLEAQTKSDANRFS